MTYIPDTSTLWPWPCDLITFMCKEQCQDICLCCLLQSSVIFTSLLSVFLYVCQNVSLICWVLNKKWNIQQVLSCMQVCPSVCLLQNLFWLIPKKQTLHKWSVPSLVKHFLSIFQFSDFCQELWPFNDFYFVKFIWITYLILLMQFHWNVTWLISTSCSCAYMYLTRLLVEFFWLSYDPWIKKGVIFVWHPPKIQCSASSVG